MKNCFFRFTFLVFIVLTVKTGPTLNSKPNQRPTPEQLFAKQLIADHEIKSELPMSDFADNQLSAEQVNLMVDRTYNQIEKEKARKAQQEEDENQPEPEYLVDNALNPNSQNDLLNKFFVLSNNLKSYVDVAKACFENIDDVDFSWSEIDKCTGPKFEHVKNDLDYEKRKLIAMADKTLNNVIIDDCYAVVGEDLEGSLACDVFKNDLFVLLWSEMPLVKLLQMHKQKYTLDRANMNEEIFEKLLSEIEPVETEFDKLNEELNTHMELTIQQLNKYIKERVDDLVDRWKRGEYNHYPKIREEFLRMTEVIPDTGYYNLEFGRRERKNAQTEEKQDGKKKQTGVNRTFQKDFVFDWKQKEQRNLKGEIQRRYPRIPFELDRELNKDKDKKKEAEKKKRDRFSFFVK